MLSVTGVSNSEDEQGWRRMGRFARQVRAVRRWKQEDVAAQVNALGDPYISRRVYADIERSSWRYKPRDDTLIAADMALRIPPGTLITVRDNPNHNLDPFSIPVYEPPPMLPPNRTTDTSESTPAPRGASLPS